MTAAEKLENLIFKLDNCILMKENLIPKKRKENFKYKLLENGRVVDCFESQRDMAKFLMVNVSTVSNNFNGKVDFIKGKFTIELNDN